MQVYFAMVPGGQGLGRSYCRGAGFHVPEPRHVSCIEAEVCFSSTRGSMTPLRPSIVIMKAEGSVVAVSAT